MRLRSRRAKAGLLLVLPVSAWMAGCGADAVQDASDDSATPPMAQLADAGTSGLAGHSADCQTFSSSFEAIQKLVFERRGCTAGPCHGETKVGGLDLREGASYESLVDVPSANSKFARVEPGTATDSFLFQKLQAATHPGSVQIAGSPMPVGAAPLTEDELQAVQLWIQKGAPRTGSVADHNKGIDVSKLLEACLPPTRPAKIKPLEPPAPEQGVQLVLPKYLLKAQSEVEVCTPFVYDITGQVPARFKDAQRNIMYVNSSRVRQDPQSHHLVVWDPHRDLTTITPDGTEWTCRGGERDASNCDPRRANADCAGGGICAGKTSPGTFCGLGASELGGIDLDALTDPKKREELLRNPEAAERLRDALATGTLRGMPGAIAHTQSPQEYVAPMDGVYWEVPMRGVMWFNSHAFNLDDEDTSLEARVNFYYADKRERELRQLGSTSDISIAAGQPPFTRKTYCAKHVVPQGYSLAVMTGHTHRRGERFWVNDPAGSLIYESFVYSDPLYKRYDPYILFDVPDPAARTLEYCATYNNGLKRDGTPDLELVTRASRMPDRTSCTPVACVAGRVTAACSSDRDCDSAVGVNDGDCDACPITGGQTTENEMFVLTPWYVLPPKQ